MCLLLQNCNGTLTCINGLKVVGVSNWQSLELLELELALVLYCGAGTLGDPIRSDCQFLIVVRVNADLGLRIALHGQ